MAEVRKKEVEDKYNTSKIKVKEDSKKEKEDKRKDVKKNNSDKKKNTKKEKKGIIASFLTFCNGVKDEFGKVHWTTKSDLLKYSIVCIFFIIFSALFFFGVNKLFEFVQTLF